MKHASTDDDESGVPSGWLRARELVSEYGGSIRTVQRWGTDGKVPSVLSDGVRYFDPGAYLAALDSEAHSKDDTAKASVVLSGSSELLRQTQQHLERIMGPAAQATDRVLALLAAENDRLRVANERLLKRHLDVVEAHEAMLSEAHERQLRTAQATAAEERKRLVLDALKRPAGMLLARALGAQPSELGAPSEGQQQREPDDARLHAARALLGSLTAEQLGMLFGLPAVNDGISALLDTDILSAEQKALARSVVL